MNGILPDPAWAGRILRGTLKKEMLVASPFSEPLARLELATYALRMRFIVSLTGCKGIALF